MFKRSLLGAVAGLFGCLLVAGSDPAPARAQQGQLAPLRQAVKAAPRDPAAHAELGLAYLRAGKLNLAQRALSRAADLEDHSPEAVLRQVQVPIARGAYRRARALCRSLRSEQGEMPVLGHVCMARAHLAYRRASRAFEALEEALQAQPDLASAQLTLGDAHALRLQVEPAVAAYEQAALDPELRAEAKLGLGRLYAAVDEREKAEAALREALELSPDWPAAQYELSRLLGRSEEALELLRKALEGRPGWAEAAAALGDARLWAGDVEGAAEAFRQALKANRRLAKGHTGLGRALHAQGKLEAAEAALKRAVELVPSSVVAARSLAQVMAEAGRRDEAIEQFKHTSDLAPRDPEPLLRAAELALEDERHNLAEAFLDRLLRTHPELPRGLALYGDIYAARGQRQVAREYYQQALAAEGELDRARVEQALEEL